LDESVDGTRINAAAGVQLSGFDQSIGKNLKFLNSGKNLKFLNFGKNLKFLN
jgi:hypothetical protein